MTPSLVVRAGSTGEAVRELQAQLRALGFEVTAEDGEFGTSTEAAVRAFQALRGIRVDGICGPETWATLRDSSYRLGDRLLCQRVPMLRGDDVANLQARLNALGFDAGKEDGILGPNTERALSEFQRNAGITTDGICGPQTIGALERLGTRAAGAVAGARERDALRDPQDLVGRRVFVAASPELSVLAERLASDLRAAGAEAIVNLATSGGSELAAAANGYLADLFFAVRPRSIDDGEPHAGVSCRCCFYASASFQSETGFAIASAVAEACGAALGGVGAACGRAYTVLRETRMPAIVCEPVIEGDEAGIAALASAPEALSAAVVGALRSVYEQAGA